MQPLNSPDIQSPHEDPVCHEIVDPTKAHQSLYRGHRFYFCSKQCKSEFDQNQQLWVSVSHAVETSANFGVL